MDERAIGELRRLAQRDTELAASAAELRDEADEVAAVRERAEAIDGFFADYPDEESRRRAAVEQAHTDLKRRESELETAQAELERARDDEARELAVRGVARATDHVSDTRARLERATGAASELERDGARFTREIAELERRAVVAGATPPPDGLPSLVAWASARRAELFVAISQLDATRERVIREANELATSLLGEPTYGSTPAQALARVERR